MTPPAFTTLRVAGLTGPRPPMASVLGADLQARDRVGSLGAWTVATVVETIPGTCTDRTAAVLGRCRCQHPATADAARMPRRIILDTNGVRQVVYDHIRYAIVARPARMTVRPR